MLLTTTVLPTTLEDVLALSLAGLAGYLALLNLPLRRAEAKAKLEAGRVELHPGGRPRPSPAIPHHSACWRPVSRICRRDLRK